MTHGHTAGRLLVTVAALAAASLGVGAHAVAPPSVEAPLPPGAVVRLGETRFRHGHSVRHVAVSPDGKVIASGGLGRGLCLWQAATGKLLHSFSDGPIAYVPSAAFSPDGKSIVASGLGRNVRVWDVTTGKLIRELIGNGPVAYSDDGKWIATRTGDNLVRVWEAATGKQRHVLEHTEPPLQLAFAPGSRWLAALGYEGTLLVWDAVTGKQRHRLQGGNALRALAFSGDGAHLAFVGEGGLYLWSTDGKAEARRLRTDTAACWCLAFTSDGHALVTGWTDGSIRVLAALTGKEQRRWRAHPYQVSSLAFSPDGKLLSGGDDSTVRHWDARTGRELGGGAAHNGPVQRLRFTADGKALVSLGLDRQVVRWGLTPSSADSRTLPSYGTGLDGRVQALSTDGKLVALAVPNKARNAIGLFDARTGKQTDTLDGHGERLTGLAFSHDGKWLASAGKDGTLRVWGLADGKQRWQARDAMRGQEGNGALEPLRFSPDDRLLLHADLDLTVRLLDAKTGKLLHRYEPDLDIWGAFSADFSPDSKFVALVVGYNDLTVLLWDTRTGKVARSWRTGQRGGLYGAGVAFSSDGRLLATGLGMGACAVQMWDVDTGQEVANFEGHHSGIASVAFARDGRTLASGGGDASILLWDVTGRGKVGRASTPQRARELWDALAGEDAKKAHGAVWEMALSADGAVPFLRARLAPVRAADPALVDRLVKRMGAGAFAVRQQAAGELEGLGASAVPGLRKALEGRLDLEVRSRVEEVIAAYLRSGEWRRQRRALAVLERGDSPPARTLLDALARGASGAPLTDEARAVNERRSKEGH